MRKVIECLECKTIFEAFESQNRKFCTHKCSSDYNKKSKRSKTGIEILCNTCNVVMYRAKWQLGTTSNHYCSKDCSITGSIVTRLEIPCSLDGCDNTCYRTPRQLENSKNGKFFCSSKCSALDGLKLIQQNKHKVTGTKPEREFETILKYHDINYIFQYSLQWINGWKKWYDFYLPDCNTLVEIDGTYWHGKDLDESQLNSQQLQTRNNDLLKNELAINQGFHLMRIWSDEIKNFDINKIKSISYE